MTAAEIAAVLQAQFPGAVSAAAGTPDPAVTVELAKLVEVCTFLRDDPRLKFALLNDITGVDYLETDPKKAAKAGFEPHVEVVYHLSSFSFPGRRFTLKVVLPRWKDGRGSQGEPAGGSPSPTGKAGELPEVPTLYGVWKTADWQEREVYDLVGVWFVGHPNLVRILLADDWVGHPLRKDYEFPLEYHGIRCR